MFNLYDDELPVKDMVWTSGLTPEAAAGLVNLIESFRGERDAWQARAEAAEKRVQELEAQLAAQAWRPVTEPPKKDGMYLVWRGHNVEPLPGWAEISGYATRSDVWRIDYPYSDSVTHWRPLPPPPTGGDS